MEQHNIPNHLAIIVDGNRRCSRQHNRPSYIGDSSNFKRNI